MKAKITRAKGRVIPRSSVYWVPRDRIDDAWPLVKDLLASGLRYSHGRINIEDLRALIDEGQVYLWVAIKGGQIICAAALEFVQYPQKRACRLISVAGGTRNEWLHHRLSIDQWARDNDCDTIELVGRPGWRKVLPDWKYSVLLEKDLWD